MKTKICLFVFVATILTATAAPVKKVSTPLSTSEKAVTGDVSFLRTHRQGNGASISWGLTTSDGVTSFVLQRTYEDPNDPYANWEDIANIPASSSRSYKFDDEYVFPGFISYRLVVAMSNGSRTTSYISTVHIVKH